MAPCFVPPPDDRLVALPRLLFILAILPPPPIVMGEADLETGVDLLEAAAGVDALEVVTSLWREEISLLKEGDELFCSLSPLE